MIYAIVFGSLFLVYYLRRYWLTPWATYVSHAIVCGPSYDGSPRKEPKYNFVTVNHVCWYPPFLTVAATYQRPAQASARDPWCNAATGAVPWGLGSYGTRWLHQLALDGIMQSAVARDLEIESLLQ